jgi:uncharacterized membrane protein
MARRISPIQQPKVSLVPALRAPRLDIARGLAIVVMLAFHFTYDLSYWHFIEADFYRDSFWLNLRTGIVSAFVLVMGMSLSIADTQGSPRKMRRVLILVVAAAFISVVSFLLFKQRFIFFGVLHFIALASVLAVFFVKRPTLALIVGSLCLVIGNFWQHALFDQPALQWIGLVTRKPLTEDYVPLVPWFGVVLLGCALGKLLPPAVLFAPVGKNPLLQNLAVLGRHSLAVYLLHQPLFFGTLWGMRRVLG